MGLFGKGKKQDKMVLEASDNAANDNDQALAITDSDITLDGFIQQVENPVADYGIQDAIELIRQLPNVNTDIVISVVIKTLESANIQVTDIISDAEEREKSIENRNEELATKTDRLEKQITDLAEEIQRLNTDFDETTKVKNLLIASLEFNKPEVNEEAVEIVAAENKEVSAQQDDTTGIIKASDNLTLVD